MTWRWEWSNQSFLVLPHPIQILRHGRFHNIQRKESPVVVAKSIFQSIRIRLLERWHLISRCVVYRSIISASRLVIFLFLRILTAITVTCQTIHWRIDTTVSRWERWTSTWKLDRIPSLQDRLADPEKQILHVITQFHQDHTIDITFIRWNSWWNRSSSNIPLGICQN